MKKLTQIPKMLLLTLCLFPSLGIAQNPFQNILIIHNAVGLPDSNVLIEVEIQNTEQFSGFSFELMLPPGSTYVSGSAVLNPMRMTTQAIIAGAVPGINKFQVWVWGSFTSPFLGNSGVVMTFQLITPSQPGIYPLVPFNAFIVMDIGNLLTGIINGTLTVYANTLAGDSDCNSVVNVQDVIKTVNFIVGNNPQPFCFENADVNGDGIVNVIDVIATINIILGLDSEFSDK